jgi:hypothetical protein
MRFLRYSLLPLFVCVLLSGANASQIVKLAEFKEPFGLAGDAFGWSVAIDGNTAVVGAPFAGPQLQQGTAYVFQDSGQGWVEVAQLNASDAAVGDEFGWSVAISGATIAIGGAFGNPGNGAIYVFSQPAGGWQDMTETAELSDYRTAPGGELGFSVAIRSDEQIIVGGAPFAVEPSVFLFRKPADGWTATNEANVEMYSKLAIPMGIAVGVNGNTVISSGGCFVGCEYRDVSVFLIPKGIRTVTFPYAELSSSDGGSEFFGWSLFMTADTIVVGDYGASAVSLFVKPSKGWVNMTQTAEFSWAASPSSQVGHSVALLRNYLVAGAAEYTSGDVTPGAVLGYKKPATGWVNSSQPNAQLNGPPNGSTASLFGWSASASGELLLVGIPDLTVNGMQYEGAAYLYGPE